MDPIPNLMEAARAGNINGLYKLVTDNPTVLKVIDEKPLVNTPLHEAASAGQTNFALEMIGLAPSFGRKLNPDGLSPLDLAVINNHYDTVKRLVSFDGELVRVKGKEGLTPLHRAAESDDKIRCLIELLLACPASIKDLTIRDETALHVAMKSPSSAETFNILYEWVRRARGRWLLQEKDVEGRSAESHHNQRRQNSLQSVEAEIPSSLADDADADTKNLYNYLRTPELFCDCLARNLVIIMVRGQRRLTMEMRNVALAVAVLIATASFQAILSPPSGLENHNKNSAQREENNLFFSLNSWAFATSVMVIAIALPSESYAAFLHLSLVLMMEGYFLSLKPVLGSSWASWSIIVSGVYLQCIYLLKILLGLVEMCNYKWVGLPFLPPHWKRNFRCLHQMGAVTFE